MFGFASSLWKDITHAAESSEAPQEMGGLFGGLMNMAPIIMMMLVVYVMMVRPANKKNREHAAFLAGLTKGDEVVTKSGMLGKVVHLEERIATLEVADKVQVRMLRTCIEEAWRPGAAPQAQGNQPATQIKTAASR